MAAKQNPPFRAEHIGSLLRPTTIPDAFRARRAGDIDDAEFSAERMALYY